MPHEKKIEYVIVGDGELENQIINWIDKLQLSNVTIIKNPEKLGRFYLEADIYFLSSIYEGLPNSIMEALNYSLPVVSTEVGDAKFLVINGENGFIVPPKDFQLLAQRLYELVCNADMRIAFGVKGHDLLIREFSESKFQEKYIATTKQIILNEV